MLDNTDVGYILNKWFHQTLHLDNVEYLDELDGGKPRIRGSVDSMHHDVSLIRVQVVTDARESQA